MHSHDVDRGQPSRHSQGRRESVFAEMADMADMAAEGPVWLTEPELPELSEGMQSSRRREGSTRAERGCALGKDPISMSRPELHPNTISISGT